LDVHLLGGFGDVEVSVGEGADRFHGCLESFVWERSQIVALGADYGFGGRARADQCAFE
jgi:hypothetical protein